MLPAVNIRTTKILHNIYKLFLFLIFFSSWTPVHSQTIPDLSRLDYETRSSIMLACALVKSQGPAAFAKCIRNQFAGIGVSPKGEGYEFKPIPKIAP